MQSLISISSFIIVLAILTTFSKPLYEKIVEDDLSKKVDQVTTAHFNKPSQEELDKLNLTLRGQQLNVDIAHLSSSDADAYMNELDGILGIYIHPKKPTKLDESETEPREKIAATPDPVSIENDPVTKSPHFEITINNRNKTVTIIGELASANEKQQLITALSDSSDHPMIDELDVSNDVTTIRNRTQLFRLCAVFLTKAHAASLEWSPKQIKLAGEMKTQEAITTTVEQFDELYTEDNEIIATNLNLIKPPSLDFTLERLSNNKIILRGTLPSKAMGDAIYQLVANTHTASIGLNNKSYIANNLRYTDEKIDAWWLGVPETFIGDFLKQTEGIAKIEYSNSGLYIEGIYKRQDEFIRARSTFQSIPKNLDVYDDFLRVKGEKNKTLPSSRSKLKDTSSHSPSLHSIIPPR